MNFIQRFLGSLASIKNPFSLSATYVVPLRGDQLQDSASVMGDFRPVFGDTTRIANTELSRHVISAN